MKKKLLIKNCEIIDLNKKFDKRGKLVIVENNKEVPFKIKRICILHTKYDISRLFGLRFRHTTRYIDLV